ncbi:Membralin [Dirofilaria immitis]|nr:Membralin [Dirofilaria immitis]
MNNTETGPGSINEQQPRIVGEQQDATQALAAEAAQRQALPQPNQFGAVRDRLFHAMLVRVAINYNRHVPMLGKRLIEFSSLLTAIILLFIMVYVHHFFDETDSNCLAPFIDQWPRNGVLRVEVVKNLKKFNAYQDRLLEKSYGKQGNESNITVYDLKRILMEGPSALPKELRTTPKHHFRSDSNLKTNLFARELEDDEFDIESQDLIDDPDASFEYVVEYSLYYGLLKLPHSYRLEHNIPFLLLDPEVDSCFGDWISRTLMKNFIGYEDVLMSSVKALAENETDKGYLRDMITGEHYRFITMGNPRASYFTALIVMLIFHIATGMHIALNDGTTQSSIGFPAAPLLTVILALVGMEAIMSEVFNDTSTAFYVILLVWIADQYDAICCHSPISKRHWLRPCLILLDNSNLIHRLHNAFTKIEGKIVDTFGMHNAFGSRISHITFINLDDVINSLDDITNCQKHSMIFFFHHYEMPLIIYHERLQRIITDLQHNPQQNETNGTSLRARTATNVPTNAALAIPSTRNVATEISADRSLSGGEASSSRAGTTASDSLSSEAEEIPFVPSKRHLAAELGESSSSVAEIDNFTLSDPLLMAGERTAHEIVDSAIDSVFNSTITTEVMDVDRS